jgi:hypothetical protein
LIRAGNEGDLKCADDCMKKSKSQASAVAWEIGFTIYTLEPGKLKRDRRDCLDFIAKQVKVTVPLARMARRNHLSVDSIRSHRSDAKASP